MADGRERRPMTRGNATRAATDRTFSSGGMQDTPEVEVPLPPAQPGGSAARYVYAVVPGSERASLGPIGIEGRDVYTLPDGPVAAVVHDCAVLPSEARDVALGRERDAALTQKRPGASPPVRGISAALGRDSDVALTQRDSDVALVQDWVLAHHRVVDAAWKRWGTVLPVSFNTVIVAGAASADENVRAWLESEEALLQARLRGLLGKAEYGVQVFWDLARVSAAAVEDAPAIRGLREEIATQPRGLAYFRRHRLERLLREEIERRVAHECERLLQRIRRRAEDVRVEGIPPGADESRMVLNLSCLVAATRAGELEDEVSEIGRIDGCSVRLVGPLPPYSFCATGAGR